MRVDAQSFRDAMARVAAPLAVVTTRDPDGTPRGFTASSICSASLDPPLVLVCIGRSTGSHPVFVRAERFIINILGATHEDVAMRFARPGIDRFGGGQMTNLEFGLPGLADAPVRLACRAYARYDAGDHDVLIGQVERTVITGGDPVVYVDRSIRRLAADTLISAA